MQSDHTPTVRALIDGCMFFFGKYSILAACYHGTHSDSNSFEVPFLKIEATWQTLGDVQAVSALEINAHWKDPCMSKKR